MSADDQSIPAIPGSPPEDPQAPTFPVVGLGASAGGLKAIQNFFEQLPSDTGMAFVVVLHLSPRHESNADKILQRTTKLHVVQVKERTRIEPDHVYVISPRLALTMEDGHLLVAPSQRKDGAPVAIDLFFRTLAQVHQHRAFAIVLSGTGSDGVIGIARIKEHGGVTFAQLPADCEYDDMPRNAIASGHVDFVLPAVEIPQQLIDVWRNAQDIVLPPLESLVEPQVRAHPTSDQNEKALYNIVDLLAERTGHDFSHYKHATMLRRMERRLQVRLLKDLPAYYDYLRTHPDETAQLLDDMLISVTNFFRDREAFESLEREVIPRLVEGVGVGDEIRIWVPGCATGEEAYSIAMLLDEACGDAPGPKFQIFATDIDARAIATARRGIYPQSIITDVPPVRLRRYFVTEDSHYRIKKPLRERVLFAVHNALSDPPFSRLDLVACRNLMIYLNRDIQEKLLELFHFSLNPGGFLFLGNSESADAGGDLFQTLDKRQRLFLANVSESGRRRPLSLAFRSGAKPQPPMTVVERSESTRITELHRLALEQYAPPSVVVDKDGDVIHMSEHAGRFLQHPAGQPSHSLPAIVDPALRLDLRGALFEALQSGQTVETRPVDLVNGGRARLTARPFSERGGGQTYVMVLFHDIQTDDTAHAHLSLSDDEHGALVQLEDELERTKRRLQATIESSDTSSEELKASNEELQAINEELRSTAEELETSKEELQSVNEELITVNAELKAKIEETEQGQDDLKNFIAASDIASVFVDSDMRIKRYTPRAEDIFSIIRSDLGRPLSDLTHRLDYPALAQDTAEVLRSLQTVEREVRSVEGRRYMAAVRPYQTANRQVDGAVLTFIDVTNLRAAEAEVLRGDDNVRHALQHSRDIAVLTTDEQGVITGWNNGAQAIFGYAPGEIIGRRMHALFTPEDIDAGHPEQEMVVTNQDGRVEAESWLLRRDGARIFCTCIMTRLEVADLPGYVKIMRDDTLQFEARQAQTRQLSKAQRGRDDARAEVAIKDDFLAVVSHELKHPLNLINLNAEIIARDSGAAIRQSRRSAQALEAIRRAVDTQGRIIDDLLDLSRVRTGKLTIELSAVDLVVEAEGFVSTAAADSAAAEIDIAYHPCESSMVISADRHRLHQIIWNLLSNAIKFTPAGGRIDVTIVRDGRYARLDVADSGQGIERSALPRIFEMFGQAQARAATRQAGLGIGLALVRQLVEHHDGRIEAVSEGVGLGACFSVWLPIYEVRREALPVTAKEPPQLASCDGIAIILVDDDPLTVKSMQALLEIEGASVRTATSVDRALALIDEQLPDIVLTDLGMPDKDGYVLLAAMKANVLSAEVSVIALTGFGRNHDVARARDAGFAAHIGKPVAIDELLRVIAETTAGRLERR